MGIVDDESTAASLLPAAPKPPPGDPRGLAYATYLLLGVGFLLPWNAFITAVDYFASLYPSAPVDRAFSISYMSACFLALLAVVATAHRSPATLRINAGLTLFALSLLVPPALDAAGGARSEGGYAATVAAVVAAGLADALVQGGVIGAAGEMPEIYMQAVCSGSTVSGLLVSVMRIITKALYPQDADGLRKSAILYFGVSIAVMVLCLICYNVADRLPIVRYYKDLKRQAKCEEAGGEKLLTRFMWISSLKVVLARIKWFGFGMFLIYVVSLAIFPGFITEDLHSEALKDWYPIILIMSYNVFDLLGKALPAVYVLENANIAVAGSIARLLFFPLYLGCLHGPAVFRTEIPVILLTCLLGLTNGYFTSTLMMHAPKTVPIQHSEMAGIAIFSFLVTGLVAGSVVSWFWVI